jgi:hypothetical protein
MSTQSLRDLLFRPHNNVALNNFVMYGFCCDCYCRFAFLSTVRHFFWRNGHDVNADLGSFAVQMTLQGLQEQFSQAVAIMKWLSDCARLVALQNQSVKWHTPLGLPVVQPYREWVGFSSPVQACMLQQNQCIVCSSNSRYLLLEV